jgi:UDP-N-acetylglucosamine 2-epimerase (non-hydrolysing)
MAAILETEKPDIVLVHGDTTTTFAGAYAAFLKQIPVGHVEAGLRTGNKYSPFPEEMNRSLVGRLADVHFCATESNRQNLNAEGIHTGIFVVGNTVIDALLDVTQRDSFDFSQELLEVMDERFILMTTHRRENLEQLQEVYRAINDLLSTHKNLHVVFPVHKNPAVREKVLQGLSQDSRVHLIEPLNYENFAHLMKHATLIITDSGGIQEEAPALGKPVLVARDNTERPEGVEAGTLKLVGLDAARIYDEANRLLTDQKAYDAMSTVKNPYGDGTSSKQIVTHLEKWLNK